MTEKRVALVTGSTRGIGKAIALRLASSGMIVVVNGTTSEERINEVVNKIRENGGEAIGIKADVSRKEDVDRVFSKITEELGRLDILINNAGITRDNLLMRMSEEDWDEVIRINLKSVFLCSKAAFRLMRKNRWGRIINISSIVGIIGNAGQANYAASKAGIIGVTKSLAKEFASSGILVNAVAPGFIVTDMTSKLTDKVKETFLSMIPLKRFGEPEDIANVVAFLVSDEASYITGQVISVNGGMN